MSPNSREILAVSGLPPEGAKLSRFWDWFVVAAVALLFMGAIHLHVMLTVGELATRSGVSVSALHFYERKGLIAAERDDRNQRRYRRDALRRVTFIRVAQRVGIPLAEVREAITSLPSGRTPTMTLPFLACASTSRSTGVVEVPNFTPPSTTSAWKRFMAGEPMKPATKTLLGFSYRSRGEPTCCSTPSLSTAMRSPMVRASVWSWVT